MPDDRVSRDVLNDKLEAFSSRVEARLTASEAQHQIQMTELKTSVELSQAETNRAIQNLSAQVDRTLAGLDKRFESIDKKLDGMEKTLNAYDRTLKTGFNMIAFTLGLLALMVALLGGAGIWKTFMGSDERPAAPANNPVSRPT